MILKLKRRFGSVSHTLIASFILMLAGLMQVQAFTVPAAGSFAYDLYNIGVNQVLLGAPGFVAALIIMIVSAVNLTRNWVMSIAGLVSGVVLVNADAITTSLGSIV